MAQQQQGSSGQLSQDAIASLITQVSPTGQPARAPARPNRPRQGTAGKKPASGTSSSKPIKATTPAAAAEVPAAAPVASSELSPNSPTSPNSPPPQFPDIQTEPTPVVLPTTAAAGHETPSTEEITNKSYASTSAEDSPSKAPVAATGQVSTVGASPIQSAAPAAGTATAPNAQSGPPAQAKKKKKGFFASLFGSCMSSSSHDDTEKQQSTSTTSTMTERKAGQANATRPVSSGQNKLQKPAAAGGVAMVPVGSSSKNGSAGPDSLNPNSAAGPSSAGAGALAAGGAAAAAVGAASFAVRTQGGSTAPIPGTPVTPPSPTISQGGTQHPPADIAPEVLAASQRGGTHLPRDETADVLSGAVQAPGSEGLTPKKDKRRKSSGEASSMAMSPDGNAAGDESHVSSASSTGDEALEDSEDEYLDEDERIIAAGGMGIPIDENGIPRPLLAELTPSDGGRKCLVLDLDETLLHSSFKQVHAPDFIVPVEIENQVHNVYVLKRPGVDAFMKRVGELYEVVVFTASLSKYADPVLDKLDIHRVVKHRLFRESCYNHKGNYVKDLSQLGRAIGDTIIIDNSPASYIFHPNNAVPVSSWFNDPHDTELTDLQHFLTDLADVPDVRGVLDGGLYPVGDL